MKSLILRTFGTYVAGCLLVVWNVHVLGFQTYQGPLNEPIFPTATTGPIVKVDVRDVANAADAEIATIARARPESTTNRVRPMILNSFLRRVWRGCPQARTRRRLARCGEDSESGAIVGLVGLMSQGIDCNPVVWAHLPPQADLLTPWSDNGILARWPEPRRRSRHPRPEGHSAPALPGASSTLHWGRARRAFGSSATRCRRSRATSPRRRSSSPTAPRRSSSRRSTSRSSASTSRCATSGPGRSCGLASPRRSASRSPTSSSTRATPTAASPSRTTCRTRPEQLALKERFRQTLIAGLVEAAAEADARLQPARLGCGWGESTIGVYRRETRDGRDVLGEVPDHPIDSSVGVIRIDDLDGDPIAVVFRYSCHPVTMGPRSAVVSSDFPGVARRVVETSLGGLALFLQGGGGNINPRAGMGYEDDCRDTEGARRARARRRGREGGRGNPDRDPRR